MKHLLYAALIALSLAGNAQAAVRVVATLPWIGSIAKEIGKDKVSVTTLVKASQDPHAIEARPSMIAAVRTADILMYNGLDLEAGYLPVLIESSRNPAIQNGKPGNFNAALFVNAIDKTAAVDRSLGDVHPLGNPHYHLSPLNVRKVALAMGERLAAIDHANAPSYRESAAAFAGRVEEKRKEWKSRLRGNMTFFAQHRFFEYLAEEYGFRIVAYLEEKPGIPPASAHLERLIASASRHRPRAILTTGYQAPGPTRFLSGKTGVTVVVVPHDVGAAGTTDWFSLMDAVFAALGKD